MYTLPDPVTRRVTSSNSTRGADFRRPLAIFILTIKILAIFFVLLKGLSFVCYDEKEIHLLFCTN